MNWDAIGASAELFAAFGVIVSLVYLGFQLRDNSNQVRASTITALSSEARAHFVQYMTTERAIFLKEQKGESLTGDEKLVARMWFVSWCVCHQTMYLQQKAGIISESDNRTFHFLMLNMLVSSDGNESHNWNEVKTMFNRDYVNYIDELIEQHS